MSADNWTECPECKKTRQAAIETKRKELDGAYGVLSLEDFDALRTEVEEMEAAATEYDINKHTFREDYEFYGAEDGEVTGTYSGRCSECGAGVEFTVTHPIKPSTR